MVDEDAEFAELMQQLQAGNEEAAWTLIETYGPHILRVVRRDLHYRMRSRFDSADFVQAAWASFFRQPSQLRNLQNPDDLLAFLLTVARNKVIDATRRTLHSRKRNLLREEPFPDEPETREADQFYSNDARPSQVAVAREQWKRLLERQTRENRKILEMRLAGATYEEIAAKLKIHERNVRKIVEDLLAAMEDES